MCDGIVRDVFVPVAVAGARNQGTAEGFQAARADISEFRQLTGQDAIGNVNTFDARLARARADRDRRVRSQRPRRTFLGRLGGRIARPELQTLGG